MEKIREILERAGFKITSQTNTYYRMRPLHRPSNNDSVLIVDFNGFFYDFATSESGTLKQLIELTLNSSPKEAEEFIGRDIIFVKQEEKIEGKTFFDKEIISNFLPSFAFYNKKGISTEILREFKSGVLSYGRFHDRYVFPIMDEKERLVGLAGRDLFNNNVNRPKWLLKGKKNQWCYPLFLSKTWIQEKNEVILVESVGCTISLFQMGIRNVLCIFGVDISKIMIQKLILLGVKKIIIATNNDSDKEINRGLEGAKKIKAKLAKYFSEDAIQICLPLGNDFGKEDGESIPQWENRIREWQKNFLK